MFTSRCQWHKYAGAFSSSNNKGASSRWRPDLISQPPFDTPCKCGPWPRSLTPMCQRWSPCLQDELPIPAWTKFLLLVRWDFYGLYPARRSALGPVCGKVLNIFQAAECGCDIVTVPHEILARVLKLGGMDHTELSLDTVRMFHEDAISAGFQL